MIQFSPLMVGRIANPTYAIPTIKSELMEDESLTLAKSEIDLP